MNSQNGAGARPSYEFDVAFSFLSADEPVATELNTLIKPHLRTFLYTEQRKEMLGPDGYRKYGNVFRRDARTVVVVYRDGWGDRGYTAIESGAIAQRVDAEGLDFLCFVPIGDRRAVPPWLPPSYIYCSIPPFNAESAALWIREQAGRAGMQPKVLTAAEFARAQADAEGRAKRQELFRLTRGNEAAQAEFLKLYSELQRIAADAPDSFAPPEFDVQRRQLTISMRDRTYPQLCFVLIPTGGGARDEEMHAIIFPNEPLLYNTPESSRSLYRSRCQIAIEGNSDNDPRGWRLRHADGRLMSSAALAEREMTALVKARGRERERDRVPHETGSYRPRSPWS